MLKKLGVLFFVCCLCTSCFSKKQEEGSMPYDKLAVNTLLLKYIDAIENEMVLSKIDGENIQYDGTYFMKDGILTSERNVSLKTKLKVTNEKNAIFKIKDYVVIYAKIELYTSIAIYEDGKIRNEEN